MHISYHQIFLMPIFSPKITFISTKVEKIKDNLFTLHGDLTIKDTTKPIVFNTTYTGSTINPWGQEVHGLQAKTQINWRAFKLVYNTLLETGGVLISDKTDINVELEINPI